MGYVGTYERTIFYNPGNKYCIISVKTSDQSVPQQARSAYRHRDNMIRFIAVGYELPQTDKVSMILDGEWENGKHGVQLQVDKCEEIVPQTKEGVYGYLSSRLIKGVGEKTAALIVNRFGADALRVLENEPELMIRKGVLRIAVRAVGWGSCRDSNHCSKDAGECQEGQEVKGRGDAAAGWSVGETRRRARGLPAVRWASRRYSGWGDFRRRGGSRLRAAASRG